MGNCVSQAGQKEFLRSLPSTAIVNSISNGENSESFRVFVKKRNKFIPGLSVFFFEFLRAYIIEM